MDRQRDANRFLVALAVIAIGAMAMVATTGCEQPDWDNPDYVAEKLAEGNTAEKAQAVERLRDIPEDRRSELAEVATEVYLEDESLRDEVMVQLIQWREPAATEAYLEELRENHTGYGDSAAEVLGEIGAEEAIDDMIEVFESTSNDERQVGILRGFSHMPDPAAVEKAVEVFELDVDNYPIDLHRAACEFIGGLAVEDPEAITDEIRSKVVYARFLASEDGRSAAQACGLAIQKIGLSMTPQLIELFEEENEEVSRLLMTYDDPANDEYFPQNLARKRAAEHLAALRAPEAVELFIEELESPIEEPDADGDAAVHWKRNEAETVNEMMRALGDIGDPAARPVLEDIVQGNKFGEEWQTLMGLGPSLGFQMLQDSARALARLGDPEAKSTLLQMTEAEIFPPMAQQFRAVAAAAEEQEDREPVPMVEQLRPQWLAARSFAYLGAAEDREDIESLAEDVEDEALAEKLESFLPAFDVMDECEGGEDDAERAECFEGFLDDEREHARNKAIMELSRMPQEVAAPVIADAIDTSDLDFRQRVTFAGYRRPSEQLATNIETVLEDEASRSGDEYQLDHRRLRMLRAWLHRQGADDVVAP